MAPMEWILDRRLLVCGLKKTIPAMRTARLAAPLTNIQDAELAPIGTPWIAAES